MASFIAGGGYAFALDRNDRFLSFPLAGNKQTEFLDLRGFVKNDCPKISDLARTNSGFQRVAAFLKLFENAKLNKQQDASVKAQVTGLAEQLSAESYQLASQEAAVIASILLGQRFNATEH